MRKLLMKAGVPLAAGAVAVAGFSGAAGAKAIPHALPTFTIAYEGPLSGGNAQLGLNMAYAVRLALNNANQGKTFGSLKFRLIYAQKDDQGSSQFSPTAAAQLVSNKNVVAVVGPAFSGATKAAEPTFHAAQLATVSPSATAVSLATFHWNNFFRVVANDNVQGSTDARYAVKTLKLKKVYAIDDASTYGQGLESVFASTAHADGATVTHQSVPGTTQCGAGAGNPSQYSGVASTIVSKSPQIVFYGGYYCDLGLLLGALHTAGYHGRVMSGDGSDDPHLIAGTHPPAAANGVFLTCACTQLGKTAADRAFAAGFTKLAHFAPGTYSAEAYDAANTEISVIKALFAHGGAAHVTRRNIVNALHAVTYVGLTKTVKFLPNGNIAGTVVYVNQVRAGKIVQLGVE
jgi:branched-chain amino acid transport system substrate-binding protein